MSNNKINVGRQYRTNELSDLKSSILIEVYYLDGKSTRIYNNIHFPDRFVQKIFRNDKSVDYVVIKNSLTSTSKIVNRP